MTQVSFVYSFVCFFVALFIVMQKANQLEQNHFMLNTFQ